MNKKMLAFDLDGTLAPSRSTIADEMADTLSRLLKQYDICVISGGDMKQFEIQILDKFDLTDEQLARLHLMPTCGTRYYRYDGGWQEIYAEDFTTEQKTAIIDALNEAVDSLGMIEPVTYGERIEDRGSQITFSALGQGVVAELGEEGVRMKEEWDPDGAKKEKLRAYVSKLIPDFEVRAGGTTSIDITKPGIDKAYGIRKLIEYTGVSKDEIIFFGDKMQPGGNDYPVSAMGVESVEVKDWRDTHERLQAFLE